MPRKGPAYPIAPSWRKRVLDRIEELRISQNELARRAKISKASLSEALDDGSVQTTVMPQIHKALGWEPPPLAMTPDSLEILALYDRLPERDKGAIMERMRATVENAKKPAR